MRNYVDEARVSELNFPMVEDEARISAALRRNASAVVRALRELGSCSYAAMGDLAFYSTFWRLCRFVAKRMPDVEIEVVPGVPSFCACAAEAKVPIAIGSEVVAIAPLGASGKLRELAKLVDSLLLIKGGRRAKAKLGLAELGYKEIFLTSRCSMEGRDVRPISPSEPLELRDYLSMVIARRRRALG